MRVGRAQRRVRLVQGPLRAGIVAAQLLGPLEVAAGQHQLGLGLRELGALDRAVELDQDVALGDRAALDEVDRDDPPVDLGPQHDQLVRDQRADRVDRGFGVADANRLRLDRHRTTRPAATGPPAAACCAGHHHEPPVGPGPSGADQQDDQDGGKRTQQPARSSAATAADRRR